MKLLLYSVAMSAMCILVACSSSSDKSDKTEDIALNKVENDSPSEVDEMAKPNSTMKFTPPQLTSNDPSTLTADTTTDVSGGTAPTVLQAGGPNNEDWDKKIIKTARVTLELQDYKSFNAGIHDRLKRYGAYIAGEQQTESGTRIENILTIKVPVALFEELMNNIGGDGIKVLEKSVNTEDVTGEVVDTKARIEAKKQVRDKYMELLKQARSMKDILAVQEEINSIEEDLEAASGRVAYLSHSAAYSTINLIYYQYVNGNSADTAEPSFLTKVKEAFTTGSAIITNVLLFLVSVWPLALISGILLLYIKKGKLKKGVS